MRPPDTRAGIYAELPGTPHAVRQARELTRDLLGLEHPSGDDAALAISELVANAISHSRSGQPGGTVTVAVENDPGTGYVRVEVRDDGGALAPAKEATPDDAEHGRGIAIIDALSAEWGSELRAHGRATWCRIPRNQPARTTDASGPEQEAD